MYINRSAVKRLVKKTAKEKNKDITQVSKKFLSILDKKVEEFVNEQVSREFADKRL